MDELTRELDRLEACIKDGRTRPRVRSDELRAEREYFKSRCEALEKENRDLLPRVAALEQASKGVTLACVYYTALMVIGGGAISGAGYFQADEPKWALLLLGWAMLIGGIIAHWVSSICHWPK
jgi:predicted phage tail protein